MMFNSSCRSSSPFSLGDLDMWDTRSRFSAQVRTHYTFFVKTVYSKCRCLKYVCFSLSDLSVVWFVNRLWIWVSIQCQHRVRGRQCSSNRDRVILIFKSGRLKYCVCSSSTGSSGGLRQNDPGLRKWQSLSHLVPGGATRPYPPTPGAKLQAARGESSFRQAEAAQWLQDTQERIDTRLDRLRARDSQLSYNMTSLLDMTQKVSKTVFRCL